MWGYCQLFERFFSHVTTTDNDVRGRMLSCVENDVIRDGAGAAKEAETQSLTHCCHVLPVPAVLTGQLTA